MVIENRDAVVAGVKLVATYKKQPYVCTVEAGEGGKLAFVTGDKSYASPSAAGTAIIGTACNGWRFWAIEGADAAAQVEQERPKADGRAKPTKASTTKASEKQRKVIYKNPNQGKVPEGSTRWFCAACMKGFITDGDSEPNACPEGHDNRTMDEAE